MLREALTENGWVRGLPAADPRITAFKGIPFAAPPVGELRWRAPQPAKNWEGILNAYTFGPIAMQWTPGLSETDFYAKEWHVDPEIPMSEDCLQLNVWTPAKKADEKLPVMVWIYGGGLMCGYPAEMEFDGERIARRGVILVSVNYRVNVFGFLAHPELTREDPEHPTNFGHLDQKFGIEWVRRNIAAFGGDPENITVFGQSAGGGSTYIQTVSPANKGLFKKAILHSGGGLLAPSLASRELADAEKIGEKFFADLGVNSLEEARKLDARTVFEQGVADPSYRWGTVIGDPFMPEHPTNYTLKDEENEIEIIAGNTEDEFPVQSHARSYEEFEQFAVQLFGEKKDEFIALCKKDGDALEDMVKNSRFNRFEIGNMLYVDIRAEHGKSTYFYTFDPEIPGDNAGSFHSSDLWFVFETLAKCWRPFKGKHYDLARQMCNYWTNFAKKGDPNGMDADGTPMPVWRISNANERQPVWFGDSVHMDERPRTDLENFLVAYYRKKLESGEKIDPFGLPRREDGSLL